MRQAPLISLQFGGVALDYATQLQSVWAFTLSLGGYQQWNRYNKLNQQNLTAWVITVAGIESASKWFTTVVASWEASADELAVKNCGILPAVPGRIPVRTLQGQ